MFNIEKEQKKKLKEDNEALIRQLELEESRLVE